MTSLRLVPYLEIVKVTAVGDFWELKRLEFFEIEIQLVVKLEPSVLVDSSLHFLTFHKLKFKQKNVAFCVACDVTRVLVDKVAPRPIKNKNKMALKLNDIIAFL